MGSGEPYIKFIRATWQCLVDGMVKSIKYYQKNMQRFTNNLEEIENRVIHPLIHCLFKSFILMSISDIKTANLVLTQFKFEIGELIQYETFVIQWREIMRNLTIE